jgi:integral membrane protein (TIGR01906 family)
LRDARLPDGTPAFSEREIAHMADVRTLVGGFYLAHVWSLAVMILVVVALARAPRTRRLIARGLLGGSLLTLAIAAVVGLMMAVAFDWFFTSFHTVFFEGMTWYFYRGDTLLRIYPEVFWSDFGFVLGALALLQAVILGAGCWWWLRRTRRRRAPALEAASIAEPGSRATI